MGLRILGCLRLGAGRRRRGGGGGYCVVLWIFIKRNGRFR